MEKRHTWWLGLATGVGLGLIVIVLMLMGGQARAGDRALSPNPPGSDLSSRLHPPGGAGDRAQLQALAPASAAASIEVFTNTWSYSTLGMVYEPGRDIVRYAHESQSSSSNPTIYDVDRVAHTVLFSVALSAQNTGWPWQLDNRTGAGYDFAEGTYFLPDYNGDLSYADDNIVEINAAGNILNAWEMDDEVGSNDSADGSEIDSIIDIAVVPGNPTRYFVTAAYDDNVVYEVVLTRTGTLWTPNSWHTVMTYTGALSETFSDNLAIDYDAQNERLYHSGWHTTTILVTDLNMNPITDTDATFECPGAGGDNSGVTFIEGSEPPEVWVTDFSSDKTTRCAAPGGSPPPPPVWEKRVGGLPWAPDLIIEAEMWHVIQVTDVITAFEPFTLTETWDPDQLSLVEMEVFPPVGDVITVPGFLQVVGPAGPPERVSVSKWFRVEPCDWISTTLEEALEVEGRPPFEIRPVTIVKQPPELHIDSLVPYPEVVAGSVASFTLAYFNTGGLENGVAITNTFPSEASFIYADPFPDGVGPAGSWARWDVGNLARGAVDSIDVYVMISETLPVSTPITIWDGIFNHLNVFQDETFVEFHVTETLSTGDWQKWVGDAVEGKPWFPGISVTRQTSDTFRVTDVISTSEPFALVERWDPAYLQFLGFVEGPGGGMIVDQPGYLLWSVPGPTGPMTVTKEFQLRTCTWPDTILWEALEIGIDPARTRPVIVNKHLPELWIDSTFDGSAYGGDMAQFVLSYGNTGGLDSGAWISNTFPEEAPFFEAHPWPNDWDKEDGRWARWDIGDLPTDHLDSITVTVALTQGLPPSTTVEIWDGIFNHDDVLEDETFIAYHVPQPTWEEQVNGRTWNEDLGVTVYASATITVTDIISTRSAVAIVEHWHPERLTLQDYTREPEAGLVFSDADFLSWEFPGGAPGTMTLTKVFHVESGGWPYTVLWGELIVGDVLWQRRPVYIDQYVILLPVVMKDYTIP